MPLRLALRSVASTGPPAATIGPCPAPLERRVLGRLPSGPSGGRSSTARAPAFQAGGAGSIPVARSSSPTRCAVLKTPEKLILGAAALLLAAGGALAIAQPGDLGDEEVASNEVAAQETTTTEAEDETSTTDASGSDAPLATTTTTAGDVDTTSTTISGSGLSATTPPTGGADGIADTGAESLLGPGLGLLALGLAGRRFAVRRPA
jgi:hypothetical protein